MPFLSAGGRIPLAGIIGLSTSGRGDVHRLEAHARFGFRYEAMT